MRAILKKISSAALAVLGLMSSNLDSSAQTVTLIPWVGENWEYNDTTTAAANLHGDDAWKQLSYDTSAVPGWKSGPPLFGNDGGGIYNGVGRPFTGGINGFITPLNRAIDAAASARVTFYFRKKFTYTGPTANLILDTSWVHDDGIVVYLNGQEILRSKMRVPAPDPVLWDTLGANSDDAAFPPNVVEGFEYVQDLSSAALVNGENIIAVELHQSSTTSSDVAFAMQMKGTIPFAPTITDTTQPTNRTVIANRSTTLAVFASGSRPVTYQWYFKPTGGDFSPILDATNSTYTIASMAATDDGEYYASAANPVGTADSGAARVIYTDDSTPPSVVRVSQDGAFDRVIVTFNEVIGNASAIDPFNFDVTDGINDPLGVTSSTPSADGKSVILVLGAPMLENTLYTASIGGSGLTDVAGNSMSPVDVQFRSWITTGDCGGVLFERYTGLSGGNVITTLTGNPKYPNSPDIVTRLPSFAAGTGAGDNFGDNYGGRLRALFLPTETANYIFYISADDSSQLFINPTGPSPAGKVLVQQDTGCCGNYTTHATAPIAMTAGMAYYIEAIYQEGGGGDYCYVAVRKQGEAAPVGRSELDAIPGSLLGSPAAPANVAGTVAITTQPANQTAVPNTTATFSVGASPDALLCYQWFRDGVAIPNAVNSQYSLVVQNTDNGAKFSVVVSILAGNTVTSGEATLTVAADTIQPTVLSVGATYSEPMDPTSAASAANYTVGGAAPASVTLNGSGTVATLVLASPLATGGCTLSEVRISGVKDTAPVGNLINPNPTTVSLSSPFIEILALGATWKYDDSGADLGTAWSATAFNDSAWLSGPAPFGFETALPAAQIPVIATPISEVSKTNTAYFRTRFNLGVNPATIAVLQLNAVVDDAAVFYINGVEAGRLRMPAAPAVITAATPATGGSPEPANGDHTFEAITIAKTALVAGDNVLAVELHAAAASSDSIFGASIRIVLCVPTLVVERVGSQVKLTWGDAAYRLEKAPAVTGPWTSQAGASGVSVPASPDNAFFRLVNP